MKTTQGVIKGIVLTCLALAFVLGLTEPANATWYMVHGSGAAIEDADNAAIVTSYSRKATGLEVKLELGTSTWVHFAVPTVYDPIKVRDATTRLYARYVKVRVNMLNNFCQCSNISEIRVYNGETLVKTFDTGWNTPGWQTITLDLGKRMAFSKGLGLSIKIDTGPNGGYDSFVFSGAGADFIKR
jgi:hypothetical protein